MILYPGKGGFLYNDTTASMKKLIRCTGLGWFFLTSMSCHSGSKPPEDRTDSVRVAKGFYGYDRDFLKKYTKDLVELSDSSGRSRVLLSPEFQGRVMTSTAGGDSGISFGWINYGLIASMQKKQHFNPYGGEERLWIGPEGGQYSVYFARGDSFNLAHWQVPPVIDTTPFDLVSRHADEAVFSKKARLQNYSGTDFDFEITRNVHLKGKTDLEQKLGLVIPDSVQWVAIESRNQILNTGNKTWTPEGGLLSIWLLSMMTPTDRTKVIIPFRAGPDSRKHITDSYFGSVPPDRLRVQDSVLYFRCDGRFRSKIGIAPVIAKPVAASFDFSRNVLTILLPEVHPTASYVNSKWEIQSKPYQGDVINAYNDGPLLDGSQLGPFYEIESSSPAASLRPGEKLEYTQLICHLQGSYQDLRLLANRILGVDLEQVKKW
jgi:hypothetical protein